MKTTNSMCLVKYQLENAKCTVGTRQLASRALQHCTYCSRHDLVAAMLTSDQPGSVIPLSKNIYCTGSTFIAAVTVDICEMVCAVFVLLPACVTVLMPTSSKCSCHYSVKVSLL